MDKHTHPSPMAAAEPAATRSTPRSAAANAGPAAATRRGSNRSKATRTVAPAGSLAQGVLADVIGYQIVQAQITTLGLYFRHVGEVLDLRPVEYSLLMLLDANTEVTPKQLAQALELSAPNLTILLDKMQERGLLDRVRSDSDRRSQHVLLTPAGQTLAQRAIELTPLMEADLDHCLSPAEQAMLKELLGKVAGYRRG